MDSPLPTNDIADAGTRRFRAEIMLILTTLVWGGTFASMKILVGTLPPMCLLTWRFGSAALLFMLLFAHRLRNALLPSNLRQGIVLGTLLYGGFALQTFGLQFTSSSRSGFITALYVIITPLLQMLITRRLPDRNVIYGVAMVLVGLWGLTAPGGELSGLVEPWQQGGFGVGDLLTLGCAAVFAVYIILLDRAQNIAGPESLTAVQLATTGLLCLVHSSLTEQWAMPTSTDQWLHLGYLSVFASVLATYWQTSYQRDTTPARAAVIFSMESVFAAIIGILLLGEHLGTIGIIGGVLIVAGLLVVQLKRGQKG